jgi:hypothetical protein
MPSSTDFRRELREADARYYELASATGHVVLTTQRPPDEQRRAPTLVAGVLAGVCLVCVGEVMHTRPGTGPAHRGTDAELAPAAVQDVPEVTPLPVRRTIVAPVLTAIEVEGRSKPAVNGIKRAARRPAPPASSPASHSRRSKSGPGVMDRLHLGWLRNAFTIRHEPL